MRLLASRCEVDNRAFLEKFPGGKEKKINGFFSSLSVFARPGKGR